MKAKVAQGLLDDYSRELRRTASELSETQVRVRELEEAAAAPIPLYLTCPKCCARHVDEGIWATKVHHTHSCQKCGLTWRPAIVPTVGVQFLPGFKNEPPQ